MGRFGCAVILAGGKSTRMGFDKQKVLIDGVLLVHYIAKQLEAVFDDILIVSNTPDLYKYSKYRVISDAHENKGPLEGIYVGLRASHSDYVYFIAGDMPVIDCDYIRHMMERLENREVFGCVTEFKGYMEPFNGFYSRNYMKLIEESIFKNHLKITRLIKEQAHILIGEEEARSFSPDMAMFMNLNTQEKVENFMILYHGISSM